MRSPVLPSLLPWWKDLRTALLLGAPREQRCPRSSSTSVVESGKEMSGLEDLGVSCSELALVLLEEVMSCLPFLRCGRGSAEGSRISDRALFFEKLY